MAKIKLGQPPKSFKRSITFPMVDGTEGVLECVYKYRTRTEFGQFVDRMIQDESDAIGDKFSMAKMMVVRRDANAQYLAEVLEGWDLDEPFNLDNLQRLCDEVPAAAAAIMDGYRAAIVEGRQGN